MPVSANRVSHGYKLNSGEELLVLEDINFVIQPHTFSSIVGPSGCGKTTLLLCLCGLLQPTVGAISLSGVTPGIACLSHKIGYVSQRPVFFEWLTILENTVLPARISKKPDSSDRACKLLQRFGLSAFANSYPHELSGGMLSRAALARALVHNPEFLFLDEAFNHLDEGQREAINGIIEEIWLKDSVTIIAITHNISEAIYLSDQVLLMSPKPSTIERTYQIGFDRPRSQSVLRQTAFTQLTEEIRDRLRRHAKANES